MDGSTPVEQPVTGFIVIHVEAAPQGIVRFTLDPEGPARSWRSELLAHDDAVIGAATSPEQTADLLVRGSIECIRRDLPSLQVGGVMMWPEPGPHNNAMIVASGEATFLRTEWERLAHADGGAAGR
ncbi:hypothetical protein [Microbacterium sp. XT11]|uniref:hypothetical protein n=1 Tax=Microbacterium sp. XT11 TaxID=367477 RepID=UPI0008332B91|nr:hypothetical protein [Microbacterium sp. XT11]